MLGSCGRPLRRAWISERRMDKLPIWMIRRTVDDIPSHHLPPGFSFRAFQPGDEELWAELHTAAGQFPDIEAARARFANDFGESIDELGSRNFWVIEDASGRTVANATAWRDPDFMGESFGQLHWVSVRPEFEGRGLGRALVARCLRRLAESHTKAYLKTKAFRMRAIWIYLDFGFEPLIMELTCPEAWRHLADTLRHPALADL